MTVTQDQSTTSTTTTRHRSWSFWLGLLLSLGCLVWAVWALDWSKVMAQLTRAQPGWLVLATGALLARIASRTARWRVFFTPPRPDFFPALTALLVGQIVNYVAPVWAGDLGRAYLLGDQTGHRKSLALGTVVVDKLCDLILFLLFLAVLPFWIDTPDWLSPATRTIGLLAALGIGMLFLGLVRRNWLLRLIAWACRPLPGAWRGKVLGLSGSLLDGLTMLRHPSTLALAVVWSLSLWGWDAAAHYCVFRALGLDLPFVAAVFLSTTLRAGFALPAMPGQVGVYEGIVVAGLGLFGVASEPALGVGLLRHAVDFVPPLVVTLILWRPAKLSKAAREPVGDRK
jgi:uncharacterized membrane protein YbhN (UPF0104 family)